MGKIDSLCVCKLKPTFNSMYHLHSERGKCIKYVKKTNKGAIDGRRSTGGYLLMWQWLLNSFPYFVVLLTFGS